MAKCYFCGNTADTKEHTPAKCFFPEGKRKNLITVSSCKKHNNETSDDDQYVRDIIAISISKNKDAKNIVESKIINYLFRQPSYLALLRNENTPVILDNGERASAFKIDRDRYNKTLSKYAKALYYKEYKQVYRGDIQVISNSLYDKNTNDKTLTVDKYGRIINTFFNTYGDAPEGTYQGDNPDIFKYFFIETEESIALIMCFYASHKIWALFTPPSS